VDAVDEEIEAGVRAQFSKVTNDSILSISAVARSGLDELLNQVWEVLELVPN
jgi:GTP-binding protein